MTERRKQRPIGRRRGSAPDPEEPTKTKASKRNVLLRRSGGGRAAEPVADGASAKRAKSKGRKSEPTAEPAAALAPHGGLADAVSRRRRLLGGSFPRVKGSADVVLAATLVALVFFGVVMVYSASAASAARTMGSSYHYLIRQTIYAFGGLGVMVVLARIDYHHYRASYVTYPILMGAFALLLVIALGGGRTVGGAARWIDLGIIRVQPAEIAKLAIIFYLAYSLSKKREQVRDFKIGFLPHILVAGIFALLCLKQPDFGSAVMIGLLTVVLLFTAGTRVNYILGSAAIALPIVYMLITGSEYRMRRINAFLNPFADRAGIGYQIAESLISFSQGGVLGVGIGESRQKLLYLPEAHTDFISAIVGEEMGLIGVLALIFAFSLITYRGLRIAWSAADDYGTYLATGVTLFVGLQAFTNLSVALALLPTKGLTLPFISYGGSSLLVNCAAVGLLLNVSREREVDEVAADATDGPVGPKNGSTRRRAKATPATEAGAKPARGRRKRPAEANAFVGGERGPKGIVT